jgi:hypothetical protein
MGAWVRGRSYGLVRHPNYQSHKMEPKIVAKYSLAIATVTVNLYSFGRVGSAYPPV